MTPGLEGIDERGRTRLVLVHGSRLSSTQWTPVRRLLPDHLEVVAPDLPGHGRRAGQRFTLEAAVDVVQEAVLGGRDGSPPDVTVVAGHSLGGYVALAHAARHGGWLDGLVLAGCSADPVGPGALVYRGVAAATQRVGERRLVPLYERGLRQLYPADVVEAVTAGGWWFAPTPDAWRAVMTGCRLADLAGLACPVMVLNGRWDQFRLGVRSLRRVLPDAEVVSVPGAGHFSCLDAPSFVADALSAFAGRCG